MELESYQLILVYAFGGAFLLGFVAQLTNFCTMGAVSDWVNMGKKGRLWSWFVAIALAILATIYLEVSGMIVIDQTIPPYRTANFAWLRYVLGGLLFGIGMTLAGGCGNKTLVNIGAGSLKSLMVLVLASIFAYLMTKTDFYAVLFHSWINATTINLGTYNIPSQSIPDMLAHSLDLQSSNWLRWLIGGVVAAVIVLFAMLDRHYRKHWHNLLASLVVGAVVVFAWYITAGSLGQEAMDAVEWLDQKPAGIGAQSYTFINPMGETLHYLMSPKNLLLITFGIAALAGVILGSFSYAVLGGKFRIVWFTSRGDFINHFVGGILMGIGGVLSMGCTIGQGISGVSTLALGSFLVLFSIIFGSALTMKIQYYRMVYEEEASFAGALLSSLADLHLLPNALRKLDPP